MSSPERRSGPPGFHPHGLREGGEGEGSEGVAVGEAEPRDLGRKNSRAIGFTSFVVLFSIGKQGQNGFSKRCLLSFGFLEIRFLFCVVSRFGVLWSLVLFDLFGFPLLFVGFCVFLMCFLWFLILSLGSSFLYRSRYLSFFPRTGSSQTTRAKPAISGRRSVPRTSFGTGWAFRQRGQPFRPDGFFFVQMGSKGSEAEFFFVGCLLGMVRPPCGRALFSRFFGRFTRLAGFDLFPCWVHEPEFCNQSLVGSRL